MRPVRAIFFDFDGVLVDSEPLHFECWAEVLNTRGLPLSGELYVAEFIGISNREMVERLCRRSGRPYEPEFFTSCYAAKKSLWDARAAERCRIPEPLRHFILSNHQKWPLAVVSSSSRCEVEPLLDGQGVRALLAALVCEEDVEKVKPAPDPYLRALELASAASRQRITPAECLVVEDSEPGVEAGRQAGMQVIRVANPEEVLAKLRGVLDVG